MESLMAENENGVSSLLWQYNIHTSSHTPPSMHDEPTCKLVLRLDFHRRLATTINNTSPIVKESSTIHSNGCFRDKLSLSGELLYLLWGLSVLIPSPRTST